MVLGTAACALALFASPTSASAAEWTGATNTDWFVSGNWNPASVPTSSTEIYIAIGSSVISSSGAESATLYLGYPSENPATLAISGAGTLSSAYLSIGNGTNAAGELTVSGGGTLTSWSGYIGTDATSTGTVTVTGSGSTWTTTTTELVVGNEGIGTLMISDGGSVTSGSYLSVSATATGEGSVTVTGTDSSLTVLDWMEVGDNAFGTITVSNGAELTVQDWFGVGNTATATVSSGAHVSTVQTAIGFGNTAPSAIGSASISGSGTTWNATEGFTVGETGQGTVVVSDGATVTSGYLGVGYNSGSSGDLTIAGTGTGWTVSSGYSALIGGNGTGNLAVSDGATLTVQDWFGVADGANGSVTVSGGAHISTIGAAVGYGYASPSAIGTATISGTETVWETTNSFIVGESGNGTVTVSDGATASSGYLGVGYYSGSSGYLTITGSESTWTVNSGTATIGYEGTGTVTISDGGVLSSTDGFLAGIENSSGTAIISGAGSTWNVADLLSVGDGGAGSIAVTNGGAVMADHFALGYNATGIGTAILSGTGSILTALETTAIGYSGQGSLTISDGGTMIGRETSLGAGLDSVATAEVTDSGSLWTLNGNLSVAAYGTGTLTVRNGGTVTVNSGYSVTIAEQSGATGTINIGAALGSAAAVPGTLSAENIVFGDGSGVIVFNHTSANYIVESAITGSGNILVLSGTTSFEGDLSAYTGSLTLENGAQVELPSVYGGSLAINSDSTYSANGTIVGSVTVASGGTLKGSGTIGGATIQSGGTVAPGNSIGTLHVSGDVSFASGSIYEVETDSTGASDLIAATGAATLSGGNVVVIGSYIINTPYTILTADGGVTGTFDSIAFGSAAFVPVFVSPTLSYNSTSIDVTMARNSVAYASAATTQNQRQVAGSLDSLTTQNAVNNTIASFANFETAATAFRRLTGELHTDVKNALIEYDDQTVDLLTALMRGKKADSVLWLRPYARHGKTYGDGLNAFDFKDHTEGTMFGGDKILGSSNRWRGGVAFGIGHSTYRLASDPGNSAEGKAIHYTVAGYSSYKKKKLTLKTGVVLGQHTVDTDRSVSFLSYDARQNASYSAQTISGFGEASYSFPAQGYLTLEPYGNVRYTFMHASNFSENGGDGALSSSAENSFLGNTTLGVRAEKTFSLSKIAPIMDQAFVTLKSQIDWKHRIGSPDPSGTFAFAGASSFETIGARRPSDVFEMTFTVDLLLTNNFHFGISYYDSRAAEAISQAVIGNLIWRF